MSTWDVTTAYAGNTIIIDPNNPNFLQTIQFQPPSPIDDWQPVGIGQITSDARLQDYISAAKAGLHVQAAVDEHIFRVFRFNAPTNDDFVNLWRELDTKISAQGGELMGAAMWSRQIFIDFWPDSINIFDVVTIPIPLIPIPTPVWEIRLLVLHDPLPLAAMAEILMAAAVLALVIGTIYLVATNRVDLIALAKAPFQGITETLILFIVAGAVFSVAVYIAFKGIGAEGLRAPSPPPVPGVPSITGRFGPIGIATAGAGRRESTRSR